MLRQRSTLLVLFHKEEETNGARSAGSTRLRLAVGQGSVGRNVCDVSSWNTDDGQTIFSFVRLILQFAHQSQKIRRSLGLPLPSLH